jgi:hypothetical protein
MNDARKRRLLAASKGHGVLERIIMALRFKKKNSPDPDGHAGGSPAFCHSAKMVSWGSVKRGDIICLTRWKPKRFFVVRRFHKGMIERHVSKKSVGRDIQEIRPSGFGQGGHSIVDKKTEKVLLISDMAYARRLMLLEDV